MNALAIFISPAIGEFDPTIAPEIAAKKEELIGNSALIGRVTTESENNIASSAFGKIKELSNAVERDRKRITEPYLEIQRKIKRAADSFRDELESEAARVGELMKVFAYEEQRRVAEEQDIQRRELERIERERSATLRRLADEQRALEEAARHAAAKAQLEIEQAKAAEEHAAAQRAANERAAEEQRIEAQRALDEAKTAPARAAAKLAAANAQAEQDRIAADQRAADIAALEKKTSADIAAAEAQAAERAAAASAEIAKQRMALANEQAEFDARIESAPVKAARADGQRFRKKWKVQINDLVLLRSRLDLVSRVVWNMIEINEELNRGIKLPGVIAEEDLTVSVARRGGKLIEI